MKNHARNETEAGDLFLNLLLAVAYDRAVDGTVSLLEDGPPGRGPAEDLVSLHRWFQGLSDESRGCAVSVLRETAEAVLFNLLVLLDGLGGYVIKGVVSDFAVYLQSYADEDARKANTAELRVRVNPAHTTQFLHDRMRWMLEDRADGGR